MTAPGCRRRSAKSRAQLCIEAAEDGLRQPVQVIEGNYNLMPGVCPWWDR